MRWHATMLFLLIAGLMPTSIGRAASILYVNRAGPGGNGLSWATASNDLQTSLASAGAGTQIWVAAGTYKPSASNDRTVAFVMKNGVELYGGFAGSETSLDQRDWINNPTVLSGDIGVADDNQDNSHHVVVAGNVGASAVLDGFTITGGRGVDAYPTGFGAGIFNDAGSPTIRHCIIRNNTNECGGGMYNGSGAKPLLLDCTFSSNSAANRGAGMYNSGSSPTLEDCGFLCNSSSIVGGGMGNANSNPTLNNCLFQENVALLQGGGMFNVSNSSPIIIGCTFAGNLVFNNIQYSTDGGAGLFCDTGSPVIRDCTFSDNIANDRGGAMYLSNGNAIAARCYLVNNYASNSGGGIHNVNCDTQLISCTFVRNFAGYGGGVYHSGTPIRLMNGKLVGNRAYSAGGAVYSSGGTPAFVNCTLSSNNCTGVGGGFYLAGGSPSLSNLIIWASADSTGTGQSAQITVAAGGTPTIDYSCVQAWTGSLGGTQNTSQSPGFQNFSGADGIPGNDDDDLRLIYSSPCVDAGSNMAVLADAADLDENGNTTEPTPVDLKRKSRFVNASSILIAGYNPSGQIDGGVVDMGAYEVGLPIPGDFDFDEQVDANDLAHFVGCQSGPEIPQTMTDCRDADLDGDGDVDQSDFGIFQRCLTETGTIGYPATSSALNSSTWNNAGR